jgi:hypothetical protein
VSLKRGHDEVSTHHWSAGERTAKAQRTVLVEGAGDDTPSFG